MGLINRTEHLPRGRRAHQKVKTGCKACKLRRQKVCLSDSNAKGVTSVVMSESCDEAFPICSGCTKHSTAYTCTKFKERAIFQPWQSDSDPDLRVSANLRKGLAAVPSPDLNLDDLELLHQYLMSTSVPTGQTAEITSYMQNNTAQLGRKYLFVMRGMLAMDATHLSRLRASLKSRYSIMAAQHQSASISDFRDALPPLNQDNCHALISYAKSLLWCSFATSEEKDENITAENITAETKGWLPRCFWLLYGSCQIVESARPWINSGPHALYQPDSRVFECSPSPDNHHIESIASQMEARVGAFPLCSTVFSRLREAFARASMQHESTPLRDAMNTWVRSLPQSYIPLLHREEPWALVALACFCILVNRSETVWFMKGHAKRLLSSIIDRPDDDWRHHIEWPIEQLDMDKN